MQASDSNLAVAQCWCATYTDSHGSEVILLEIRQSPGRDFLLHTKIRSMTYHILESKFLSVMSELMRQLPIDASLSVKHDILLFQNGVDQAAQLIERISTYNITDGTADVGYQLILSINGQTYITQPRPEVTLALQWLTTYLGAGSYLKICAFCEHLFEDDVYGGSDGHRDLMYCFRDRPDILQELKSVAHKSSQFPRSRLHLALQDVDAFHSCAAFALTHDFETRIEWTRNWLKARDQS